MFKKKKQKTILDLSEEWMTVNDDCPASTFITSSTKSCLIEVYILTLK